MRILVFILAFIGCTCAHAQVYTFECQSGSRFTGDSCDICPSSVIRSRSFNGLAIYRDGNYYRWLDQPYSIRVKPGNLVEYWEHGANPYSERITIPLALTGFSTVQGMADSTWCNFTAPDRAQNLDLDSIDVITARLKLSQDDTPVYFREGTAVNFTYEADTMTINVDTTGLGGGGGGSVVANNGVSDNENGGDIRLGNRYMGSPDAPFTMNRKLNIDGRFFYLGDLSDSTMLVADGSSDRIGIGTDLPTRKADVNGEFRVRDLTTTAATVLVGADADGVFSSLGLGSNLQISGGNLTIIGLSYQGLRDDGTDMTKRAHVNFVASGRISTTLTDDAVNDETEVLLDVIDNSISNAKIRQGSARSVIGVTGNAAANVADIQGTADQVLRVNTAGNALAFGQVATGGIADGAITTPKIADAAVTTIKIADANVTTAKIADANVTTAKIANLAVTTAKIADANVTTAKIADNAVTYAKIQTAAANNVLLGNNNGAGTNYEEINAAAAQTMLGFIDAVALANQQIAYGSDANTITSEAAFLYDAANDRLTINCATPGLGAGTAIVNLANVGTDGTGEFLRMQGAIDGNMLAGMYNSRTTAGNNTIFTISQAGDAASDPILQLQISGTGGNTTAVGLDNSDANKFKITPNANTPGANANASLVGTNAAVPLWGINKDAPLYPLDIGGRARSTQWINTDNEPTVGAVGNGLGVGGAINDVTGTNNGFSITFTCGTTPTANGDLFTVTYQTSFPTFAIPVFCQGDDDAADELSKFYFSVSTGASFTMKANGTLTAGTQYVLHFVVTGF